VGISISFSLGMVTFGMDVAAVGSEAPKHGAKNIDIIKKSEYFFILNPHVLIII
jgi:hypothetical protein